jgi:rhodanese-related sulfurtransferase
MKKAIDAATLKAQLEKEDRPALLDVRRKADYETTPQKIPGAVWLDPEQIDQWSRDLAADRKAVVYCVKGGSVSQSVAETLQEQGIEVKYLEGGLKAWVEQGEPVA